MVGDVRVRDVAAPAKDLLEPAPAQPKPEPEPEPDAQQGLY